jgi:small redox-active disulfide protein 2
MKIEILGTGCAKCKTLYDAVQAAVKEKGVEAEIVKVEDIPSIMKYGVMSTPALVIDGRVIFSGRTASAWDQPVQILSPRPVLRSFPATSPRPAMPTAGRLVPGDRVDGGLEALDVLAHLHQEVALREPHRVFAHDRPVERGHRIASRGRGRCPDIGRAGSALGRVRPDQ